MKKIFTLAGILLATTCAMAQTSISEPVFEGDFEVIPKTLNSDGKSYIITGSDEDISTAKFYNPELGFDSPVTTITIGTIPANYYNEVGKAKVTVILLGEVDYNEGYYYFGTPASEITSSEELAEIINKYYGYDHDNFVATTIPGTDYIAAANGFWYPDKYGYKYPYNGICIKDGEFCGFYAGDYRETFDCSNTVWTPYYGENRYAANGDMDLYDVDNGTDYHEWDIIFSQGIFNNDTNWEWVELTVDNNNPTYEVSSDVWSYSSDDEDLADGEVMVMRGMQAIDGVHVTGLKVMSMVNGVAKTLATIPSTDDDFDVYILNGKAYFLCRTGENAHGNGIYSLFEYTEGTNGVKEVLSNIPNREKVIKTMTEKGISINTPDGKKYSVLGKRMK